MIYIDIKEDKTKKRVDTYLNFISVDHKNISDQTKINKQDIIICDNEVNKIQDNKNKCKNLVVFNYKKNSLKDKLFFEDSIYICNIIDEIEYALASIHQKEKSKERKTRLATTATLFVLCILLLIVHSTNVSPVISSVEAEEEPIVEIPRNIVFFGDSITAGYPLEESYPDLPVINRGFSGYTTINLLNIVRQKVVPLRPGKVFLLIGTNDIAYTNLSNEEIVNNIKQITSIIKESSKDTEIYIESIYPVKESLEIAPDVWHVRDNNRIQTINKMIEELCQDEKYTYIDLYNTLVSDGSMNMNYSVEGLHINNDGYKVISEVLKKYIQ